MNDRGTVGLVGLGNMSGLMAAGYAVRGHDTGGSE